MTPTLVLQIPWQWHDGGHMSMHWGWWLVLTLVIAFLAWTAVQARPGPGAQPPGSGARESPEEVLRRRFAAGEIDEAEYDRRLRKLRGSE